MAFSKIRFGEEETITTIIEDLDGRELERWKVMKKDYAKNLIYLNKKYGLGMYIIDKKRKNKDLDWAL